MSAIQQAKNGLIFRIGRWIAGRVPQRAGEREDRHLLHHEILEAAQSGVCPICLLLKRAAVRRLESLFHESVNDPYLRDSLRRSLGFCSRHTLQALDVGDHLGIAILYEDVAARARRELAAGRFAQMHRGLQCCPLCNAERADLARYCRGMAQAIRDSQMRTAFSSPESAGLCLRHLGAVLQHASPDAASFLSAREAARLDAVLADLAEFIRKQQYLYADEPAGRESDAWQRAARKVAGWPSEHDSEGSS